jgi:lysophospholipase L1-like esterase
MKVRFISQATTALCAMALGLVWATSAGAAPGDGTPGDTNIFYAGRWDRTSSTFYASNWAGAYLRTGFTGTTVRIRQRNSVEFWASIDGRAFVKFTGVSGTVNLTPTPLASGNHTLVVNYRQRAGSYNGDAVFGGLVLDPGASTFALPTRGKLIEFIGDSITAGTLSTNLALTDYGWLVGERLGAEHTQIAIGGACLVASADGCWGMEQRYFKIDAASASDWDFSRYRADAVVINLGTNDVGHSVTGPQFQSSYIALLRNVRAKYPAAAILALKTFRGRYIAETQNAVTTVNNSGDRNVFFVNTDGWLTADGLADAVHPNDLGHQQITNNLAPIVAARLGSTRRFEAEAGTCDGTIDSNHAGFSGTGFCNGNNAIGAAVQFTVTATAASTATIAIRYANGTTTARPADVSVNGVRVLTATFAGTGAWTAWTTTTLSVPVNAGTNTIRVSPTTSAGLPNVDCLDVTP